MLANLNNESVQEIDDENGLRMEQPENVRAQEGRLRALFGVKARFQRDRKRSGDRV